MSWFTNEKNGKFLDWIYYVDFNALAYQKKIV